VRDKRQALEQALRERLSEMRTSYFEQLDRTGQEFLATARILARPVLLEAQARRELAAVERRVAESVLRRNRQAVGALRGQLGN
jgi:type II secretory pathway component PulJ